METIEKLQNLSTDELRERRRYHEIQRKRFDNRQNALKVMLNSCYGALGSPYFRFFDIQQAMGITISGQTAIKWVARDINGFMISHCGTERDRIIAIDTDSNYVDMTDVAAGIEAHVGRKLEDDEMVTALDKFCEKRVQPVITDSYDRFFHVTNAYVNRMNMDREAIGKAFFVRKKRYVIKVYDDEGVRLTTPKIKVSGLEAKRSEYPKWCRDRLKELYAYPFDKTNKALIKRIEACKKEFRELSLSEIANASSANNIAKWTDVDGTFIKGAPYHIRATIAFNTLLEKCGLQDQYEPIKEGEKIKLLPLKKRNPLGISTIAFKDTLPEEFGLHPYLNIKIQYEKKFEKPAERTFKVVGWRIHDTVELQDILQ